jgi:hypothetical protein
VNILLIFPENYDQQVPIAWLKKNTPTIKTTPKVNITTRPIETRHCFNYEENVERDGSAEVKTQCETTAACGAMFDLKTSDQNRFCDEENLCNRYNVTFGECTKVCIYRNLPYQALKCSKSKRRLDLVKICALSNGDKNPPSGFRTL